ncbi:hypothetical protein AgCh_031201 [Apium graveolens]
MEEAFASIQIEDEENGGLNYENVSKDLSEINTRWCLIGRFVTDSTIDFQAMKHTMAALWGPGRGVYIKQLESNGFFFQFYHEVDIRRVIEGSPWKFDRFHLVLQWVCEGDNPRTVEINNIDLWVQLHDMSTGFMSQRVATDIGNYIGRYIDGDPNNFVGFWREFLRIRVSIPLNSPIKRRMKLKKSEKEWCWVNFKYEAIPTFCFICGMMGHGERFCDRIFDSPIENIEKPYGAWLRADPRRRTHTMGSKWLRNGGDFQARNPVRKGGLGSPGKIQFLKDMTRTEKPSFIFLSKTISNYVKTENFCNILGFDGFIAAEPQGKSGGVALFWTNTENVKLLSYSRDFNNVTSQADKKGGAAYPSHLVDGFNDCLQDTELQDLNIIGHQFTFERGRNTDHWVEIHLDRVLVNTKWSSLYQNAKVYNLERSPFDHSLLLLVPEVLSKGNDKKQFHFENAWLTEHVCFQIIKDRWEEDNSSHVATKVKKCAESLEVWGREITNCFGKRIKECKLRMRMVGNKRDPESIAEFDSARK